VRAELEDHTPEPTRVEEEIGDLFFSLANLARKLGVEPEAALRIANDKFQQRFDAMERTTRVSGRSLRDLTLAEMEAAWQAQKAPTTAELNTKTTKTATNTNDINS
jgi:uncharacterized protein YabN with tetrapyrrole methylase and pyrophosphatase domain